MAIRTIDDASLVDIASAIRDKLHNSDTYRPDQMAVAIASIPVGEPDWLEIGYEGAPQIVLNGFNYAKSIQENWDSTIHNRSSAFKSNAQLLLFPAVDTSEITNANQMFSTDQKLIYIPEGLDFSSLTDASSMFAYCYALEDLTLTGFGEGLQRTINASYLAIECKNLLSADVDCKYITNLSYAFQRCYNLSDVNLSNTESITNFQGAFIDCYALEGFNFTIDLSSATDTVNMMRSVRHWKQNVDWDLPECTNADSMFAYCGMTPTSEEDSGFFLKLYLPKVTNIDSLCREDTGDPLHKAVMGVELTTSNTLKEMSDAFHDCTKMLYCTITNTSKIGYDKSNGWTRTFMGCSNLETLSTFDMSYCQGLEDTFNGCSKITALNTTGIVGDNDGSNAGLFTAIRAFKGCTLLETVPIINLSRVTNGGNLNDMFLNCPSLSDTALDNILQSCLTATNYPGNKTLYQLGLRSSVYPVSRLETLDHWQDFLDANWIAYPS